MTKALDSEPRCQWCRRKIEIGTTVGRPRAYCRQSCRQRAYESRQQSSELGLSENELVITKAELERLLDQVYVLAAAVEDVERDIAADDSAAEARRSLKWLLSAAKPLSDTQLL